MRLSATERCLSTICTTATRKRYMNVRAIIECGCSFAGVILKDDGTDDGTAGEVIRSPSIVKYFFGEINIRTNHNCS